MVTSAIESATLDRFIIEETFRGSIYRMISIVSMNVDIYLAIADMKHYLSIASDHEKRFLAPPVLQQLYNMIEKFVCAFPCDAYSTANEAI